MPWYAGPPSKMMQGIQLVVAVHRTAAAYDKSCFSDEARSTVTCDIDMSNAEKTETSWPFGDEA